MHTPTMTINRIGTDIAEITKGGRNNVFRASMVLVVADNPVRDLDLQNGIRKEDR